jgi:hypothetical protein
VVPILVDVLGLSLGDVLTLLSGPPELLAAFLVFREEEHNEAIIQAQQHKADQISKRK